MLPEPFDYTDSGLVIQDAMLDVFAKQKGNPKPDLRIKLGNYVVQTGIWLDVPKAGHVVCEILSPKVEIQQDFDLELNGHEKGLGPAAWFSILLQRYRRHRHSLLKSRYESNP